MGVDLLGLMDGEPPLVNRIRDDLVLAIDVLFATIEPQAEMLGVSDEQFGLSLDGTAASEAVSALWGAIADFFPAAAAPGGGRGGNGVGSAVRRRGDTGQTHAAALWRLCWRAAGACGLEPDGRSLRELLIAAEAAWEPHAELLALAASYIRDPQKRSCPYSSAEMNPFSPPDARRPARTGIPLTRESIGMLRTIFCRDGGGKKKR
jgi:hypothetical protein